jgi:hypothetical protein
MFKSQQITTLLIAVSFVLLIGISTSQAEEKNNQNMSPSWAQNGYGNMGGAHPMFNPAMWMNPSVMMNPNSYMSLMNPNVFMNPNNYMQMMNPNAYMSMMNPMMGMMGPMMGMMAPMMGMGGMSSMMNPMGMMGNMGGMNNYGANNNPMSQMMDPKQYENWFKQWTESMQNMAPQTQAAQ